MLNIHIDPNNDEVPQTVYFGKESMMIESPVAIRELRKAFQASKNEDQVGYNKFVNNAIKAEQGLIIPNEAYNPLDDDYPLFI